MHPLAGTHMTYFRLEGPRAPDRVDHAKPSLCLRTSPSLRHPPSGIVAEVDLSDDVRRLRREVREIQKNWSVACSSCLFVLLEPSPETNTVSWDS